MPLSLNQQQNNKYSPEDPGTPTYQWIKKLYFKTQEPDKDIHLPDNIKQKIVDYLQTITDHQDKRNWENADQQRRNAIQFAKNMDIDLTQVNNTQ